MNWISIKSTTNDSDVVRAILGRVFDVNESEAKEIGLNDKFGIGWISHGKVFVQSDTKEGAINKALNLAKNSSISDLKIIGFDATQKPLQYLAREATLYKLTNKDN